MTENGYLIVADITYTPETISSNLQAIHALFKANVNTCSFYKKYVTFSELLKIKIYMFKILWLD